MSLNTVHLMRVPYQSLGCVVELKALKETHLQFHIRVEAAQTRVVETRKVNAMLTQRLIDLKIRLKEAKDSNEVRS